MKQLAIIIAALAVTGCATKKYRAECEAEYPEATTKINQCVEQRREIAAEDARIRREDREAKKAACRLPNIWVEPPGQCYAGNRQKPIF